MALAATVHQTAGVVGMMAADHHHGLHPTQQLLQRDLTIFRGLTYCINELNLGMGIELGNLGPHRGGYGGGGGGLADNAKFGEWIPLHRLRIFHNRKREEVFHNAVDFHMTGRADHNDMATLIAQTLGGGMGLFDQRTSGVNKLLARRQQRRTSFFADAVGGYQHAGGIRQAAPLAFIEHLKAAGRQPLAHQRVMHQLSKYRYLHRIADGLGFGQGIAHAKAHAHVLRFKNLHDQLLIFAKIRGSHTLQRKVIS